MEIQFWILVGIDLAIVVFVFWAKHWMKAQIERSVQHKFDAKLKALESDLRKSEERFKSDLQASEARLSAVRSAALSDVAQRRIMLDKRRMEAVERLWSSVIELQPYENAASYLAFLKLQLAYAAKRVVTDIQFRQQFIIIEKSVPSVDRIPSSGFQEQPFISPLAWSYFRAYRTVVVSIFGLIRILASGMKDADKALDFESIREVLRSVLPDKTDYIDENEIHNYYFLLKDIKSKLLDELRLSLDSDGFDKESVERAAKINAHADAILLRENASITIQAAGLSVEKGDDE